MTDIVLPYALKPWQSAIKGDPHRFKVIVAGRRSGKTTLAVDWLITTAPTDDVADGESMSWYVGPTYTAAEDIAWSKLKMSLAPFFSLGLVKRVYESDLSIQFKGGQWIQLKGGDKPDSLRGVKLRRLVIDEFAFMKPEIWTQVLQPATSDYLAPVMFIGSPCGFNHLYELAQYEADPKRSRDWKTWTIKTSEAGTIPADELDRARRDMDERAFRQEYEASFETFGGRVFSDFDRSKHVRECEFNPGLEYHVGMDFGWSAPTACAFINVTADETVYVFDEYDIRETPIAMVGKAIKDRYPATPLISCDPAGDSKNEAMGTSSVQELRAIFGAGQVRYLRNYPGIIQDGVNQIRKWLRNGKLVVSPRCQHTIQALEMYRYPDPKADVQSELPLKDGISDHHVDKLRYFFLRRFPVRQSTVGAM